MENTNPLWCSRAVAYSRGRSAVPSPAWSAFVVCRAACSRAAAAAFLVSQGVDINIHIGDAADPMAAIERAVDAAA